MCAQAMQWLDASSAIDCLILSAHRLGFRELGTTIGVQCNALAPVAWQKRVQELHNFWGAPERLFGRDSDITPVMYCTSLLPGVMKALAIPPSEELRQQKSS